MGKLILLCIVLFLLENMFLYCLVENKIEGIKNILKDVSFPSDYSKKRYLSSLLWYEEYAYIYRFRFILYSTINIILSASLPLVTLWGEGIFSLKNEILIGVMSTLISIISGYLYLREPKSKWREYRKYAEKLKRLLSLKLIKKLSEGEFLLELENILEKENKNWYLNSKVNKESLEKTGEEK